MSDWDENDDSSKDITDEGIYVTSDEAKRLLRKKYQKNRTRKIYAKELKGKKMTENLGGNMKFAITRADIVRRNIENFTRQSSKAIIAFGGVMIFLAVIVSLFISFSSIFTNQVAGMMNLKYKSTSNDIEQADLSLTKRELDMINDLKLVEVNKPGYDAYIYDFSAVGHNPNTLIAFLSARYDVFLASQVEDDLEEIFSEMYTSIESEGKEIIQQKVTKTRTVTKTGTRTVTDPNTHEQREVTFTYEVEEPYEVIEAVEANVYKVEVKAVRPLELIVSDKLDVNEKKKYDAYVKNIGMLPELHSPVDILWYGKIDKYYGYIYDEQMGTGVLHRGIDIDLKEGSKVHATHHGIVTEIGEDTVFGKYIVLDDGFEHKTKYGHLKDVNVKKGQEVPEGTVIGTVGMSGTCEKPILHFEYMYKEEYLNPYFYFLGGN